MTNLNGSPVGSHVGLARDGVVAPGEFLGLRLAPGDHGNGQQLLIHTPEYVQRLLRLQITYNNVQRKPVEAGDVVRLLLCSLVRGVGSVALLPQELTVAEERLGMLEFPAL